MCVMLSDEVKTKVAQWESELKEIAQDDSLKLMVTCGLNLPLTLEEIGEVVMHATGITLKQIQSIGRQRHIVHARHLVAYYARNLSSIRWHAIGEYMGGRDHTTAIHGYQSIKDLLDSGNPQTVSAVARIDQYLEEIKVRVKNQN